MKKLILLLMILTLGVGISLQASKPIPSYKAKVYTNANFQEKQQNNNAPSYDPKGKRDMNVVASVAGPMNTQVIITVYSLDLTTVLGPFIIYGDGQISVPIDDRDWGVIVQCIDKVTISVWSSASGTTLADPANL